MEQSQTIVEVAPAHCARPPNEFLRAYWEGKRAGRAMPRRSDISPSQLREHLGWVMILEVMPGAKDFRYRLIGTLVTEYFSADATGKTVMDAFTESQGADTAKAINYLFHRVAKEKIVIRVTGAANWLDVGMEEFESVYLPLSDDGETVSHILHAFVCDREKMLMARQIARMNGGKLVPPPPKAA